MFIARYNEVWLAWCTGMGSAARPMVFIFVAIEDPMLFCPALNAEDLALWKSCGLRAFRSEARRESLASYSMTGRGQLEYIP